MPKMPSSQLKAFQSTPSPLPLSLVTICLSSSQLPVVLPSSPLVQVGRDGGEEDVLLHSQLLQCFHVPVSTTYNAKRFGAFCFSLPKVTVLLLLSFKCHRHTRVRAHSPCHFDSLGREFPPCYLHSKGDRRVKRHTK